MTKQELIANIQLETEWLQTTNGDEVECISIENLEFILTALLNSRILLSVGREVSPVKDMLNFPHKQLNIFES